MFTGIIQLTGTVIQRNTDGSRIRIHADQYFIASLSEGDSVSCDGICLTAVALKKDSFSADLSSETLNTTKAGNWTEGRRLNLEPAMSAQGRFGGHIVTGHVDGLSEFLEETDTGNGIFRRYSIPQGLEPLVATKGSVCLNGVSLTVNKATMTDFTVMLIPHTLSSTTLGDRPVGDTVNIEADIAARYLLRIHECTEYINKHAT